MTNREKFKAVFGFDGSIVSDVEPDLFREKGSCGYDTCYDSCASRHFPRCPMWWNDQADSAYTTDKNSATCGTTVPISVDIAVGILICDACGHEINHLDKRCRGCKRWIDWYK